MKLNTRTLREAANIINGFTEAKAKVPDTEKYLRIKPVGKKIRLSIYNNIVRLTSWANFTKEIQDIEEMCIDARKFNAQLMLLDCDQVDLKTDVDNNKNRVLILKGKTGKSRRTFRFRDGRVPATGSSPPLISDFAKDKQDLEAHPILIKAEDFCEAVQSAYKCINAQEEKFAGLKDIMMCTQHSDKQVSFIGASLKILACIDTENENTKFDKNFPKEFILDARAANVLHRAASGAGLIKVYRTTDSRSIGFEVVDKFYLEVRGKNTKYAPYNRLFTIEYDKEITVDKKDLLLALEQLFTQTGRVKIVPAFFHAEDGTLTMEADYKKDLAAQIKLKYDGKIDATKVAVYPEFLARGIHLLHEKKDEKVTLSLRNSRSPIKLIEGSKSFYVMAVNTRRRTKNG